ncbi:MAG: ATP-binding protein [Meiothermus sp.]|nr:ATP-binding protein [Meiothermus sp.]
MGRALSLLRDWSGQLGVQLALLILLAVGLTSLLTFALSAYGQQRAVRDLPEDLRTLLENQGVDPLPLSLSKLLNREVLATGQALVVLDGTTAGGQKVYRAQPAPQSSGSVAGASSLPPEGVTVEEEAEPDPRRGPSFTDRLLITQGVAAGVSLLLGLGLAISFARRLARPIREVSEASDALAGGRRGVRLVVNSPNRETDHLAHNFNRMAESLERLEGERKAMIADIAHELRTPIAVIQGRLEAIQDGLVEPNAEEVNGLHSTTQLMARLVDDLRTLSLSDAGRLTVRLEPLELRQAVGRIGRAFRVQAEERGVRLELDLPEGPVELEADWDRLRQVLGNLLSNALAHTPAGGEVRLTLGREGSRAVMRVQDTGPGIPEAALTKVFDRFYRVEASRSRATGGSGLGLAIVKSIVELHGGQVSVSNRPQGGAEFRVELPIPG